MRRARIKADGAGYYHCMSRVIERRHILGDPERERLRELMQDLAAFGGLHILAYCLMSNHFHILVHVPAKTEIADSVLLARLPHIMDRARVRQLERQLHAYRQGGEAAAAEALKARYTYRMHDISEFFKALKQRFSQYYNTRERRKGPLWEQRFKSLLVEGSEQAMVTMAAYIELNPVRAGMVRDPKDYRFSSYGAAVGGHRPAREGLRRLLDATVGLGDRAPWARVQRVYRQRLYVQGERRGLDGEGSPVRPGFTAEQVQQALREGGRLPLSAALRCRVRYFSDGLAMGGTAFVQSVFERYRSQFGPRRATGPRPMRFGEWNGLCTMRDLRRTPVSPA